MSEEKVKKVSKKKILFVDIDEELTSVFDRISKLPYKEIYLVVPKRAVILQSVVNLKILKQKLVDVEKNMSIITNDTNGMNLAQQAEIKVFDHWDFDEKQEEKAQDENSTLLRPVSATSNEVDESLPSRLPKKKSSIFEVVRTLRAKDKGFSLKTYLSDRKKNKLSNESWKLYLPGGSRKFITGLLAASLASLFFVAYVVLPGATLYIEPASEVISKSVNINLERAPDDPRTLKSYAIETSVDLTISHSASGVLSEGNNASGNISIINTTANSWPLIAQTRFQNPEGIVYRLQNEATVPAGSIENPGKLEAFVVADSLDTNGIAVGARGNIGPSSFILPALRESSQTELYAESFEDMTGGETAVSAIVLEDDLVAAREKLELQLKEKALSSLRKETLSMGNQEGVNLDLLEDSDVLEYGTAVVDMPFELLGDEMEEFEISGTLRLSGVAFDNDALLAILKNEIISVETPGKQLIKINDDSISINVLEVDNVRLNYKFTAQIQGIEEYEIDPDLEGGSRLNKKINHSY